MERFQRLCRGPNAARMFSGVGRAGGRSLAGSVAACRVAACCALAGLPSSARAQVDPNSGIDFVRVGAVGNAAWAGDGTVGDRAVGRGSVGYEYSIGRFEVTTAQWAEFFNAAFDRPAGDSLPHVVPPTYWGATGTAPHSPPTIPATYSSPMASHDDKPLMRSLGEFLGHIIHGVKTDPAKKVVRKDVEVESRNTADGKVILRRTIVEEVEVRPKKSK